MWWLSTVAAKEPGVPKLNTANPTCEEPWTVAGVPELYRAIRLAAASCLAAFALVRAPDAVDREAVPVDDEEGATGA